MVKPHWIRRRRPSDLVFHVGLVVAGLLVGVILGVAVIGAWLQ